MNQKRTYFGLTTPQQRKLLFETWEATDNVALACRKARVSRGLFYYWKERFDRDRYAGLEKFDSRVAHKRTYKDDAIVQRVIGLRRQNPEWGKARIAHEMAKANNWVSIVSPNTVKRILKDAGLWPESGSEKKSAT